MKGSAVGEIEP